MGLGIKTFLIRMGRKAGFEIIKYPTHELETRLKIMDYCKINKLFDVGANKGQYAILMRKLGFTDSLISFEPLSDAFVELQKVAEKDKNWTVNNYALGKVNSENTINIAANLQSSSILEMLPAHLKSAPQSEYVGTEKIEVKTLDSVFGSCYQEGDNVMLKIDTQGYEKRVLEGAEKSLANVRLIQLEMSTIPLYSNELLFHDMIKFLDEKGFRLFALETNFLNPHTGQILQYDGIFVNKAYIESLGK